MMTKKIMVYGTQGCPYCHSVRNFFTERGIDFEYIDVGEDQEKAREMVEKSGQMGVPVVFIDDKIIVGFDREEIERSLE